MMWLPTKVYEALPVFYVMIGALLLIGASYIGVNHGMMPGYIAIGSSCLFAGMYVTYLRRRARSSTGSVSLQH
jgi:hypothetical protein